MPSSGPARRKAHKRPGKVPATSTVPDPTSSDFDDLADLVGPPPGRVDYIDDPIYDEVLPSSPGLDFGEHDLLQEIAPEFKRKAEPPATKSWATIAMDIGGWLHEAFTVLVAAIDISTDLLVAWQFYANGHTTWFWLVLTSIFLSSCVFTFLFDAWADNYYNLSNLESRLFPGKAWTGSRHRFKPHRDAFPDAPPAWYRSIMLLVLKVGRLPRLQRTIVVFPISQLVPFGHWLMEVMGSDNPRYQDGVPTELESGFDDTRATAEEMKAFATDREVLTRLRGSMDAHLRKHVMFYIETVLESVPQVIIQLLAMSQLDDATPLQLLSLMLSLSCIVSKCYLLCQSFDLRMFAFKYALAVVDIVGAFYLFSTVLASGEPQEVGMPWAFSWMAAFSGRSVSWLTYAALTKLIVESTICAVFLSIFGIAVIKYDDPWKRDIALCLMLGLVCFIPGCIVLEIVKLSLITLGCLVIETDIAYTLQTIFSFCERGGGGPSTGPWCDDNPTTESKTAMVSERVMRYRYLLYHFAAENEKFSIDNMWRDGRFDERYYSPARLHESALQIIVSHAVRFDARKDTDGRKEPEKVPNAQVDLTVEEGTEMMCDAEQQVRHYLNEVRTFSNRSPRVSYFFGFQWLFRIADVVIASEGTHNVGKVILTLMKTSMFIHVPLSLISITFPLAHVLYVGFGQINLVQQFCITLLLACYAIGLLFLPLAFRYISTVLDFGLMNCRSKNEELVSWITEYLTPKSESVLRCCCAESDLLPMDVVGEVATFISSNALNLKGASREEWERYRRAL